MPAPSAAWRAGAWPRPADSTQPMITSSISAAATPESASAALIATEPELRCGDAGEDALKGADRACGGRDRMTTGSELMGSYSVAVAMAPEYNRWRGRLLGRQRLADRLRRSARGCAAARRRRRPAPPRSRSEWACAASAALPAWQHVAGAVDGHRDDRHVASARRSRRRRPGICRSARVASKVPSGKNTRDWPVAASFHTRRASEPPLWRSKRSTNAEPSRRSNRPASGTRTISFLMTKAKSGGKRRRRRRCRRCSSHDWRPPRTASRGSALAVPRPAAECRRARKNPRENAPATRRRARRPGRNRLTVSAISAQCREQHEAIGRVKALPQSGRGARDFCDLVLLMLILAVTVRLVTPTRKRPSHTANRQRVQHHFVRLPRGKLWRRL